MGGINKLTGHMKHIHDALSDPIAFANLNQVIFKIYYNLVFNYFI